MAGYVLLCQPRRHGSIRINVRPMSFSSTHHVAIIGAGISGLTAALSFAKLGWQVTVLEQKEAIGEAGAGIQISPNAMHVLRALDLEERIETHADAPQALTMRDGKTGRLVFSVPLTAARRAQWGAPYLHMHRSDLISQLAAALDERQPHALSVNTRVESVSDMPEHAVITCANGTQIAADLVIAADGIRSSIREMCFPHMAAHYSGYTAWRMTLAPRPQAQIDQSACVWTGSSQHAVTYPLRGGRLINFVGIVRGQNPHADLDPESWTQQGHRDEVLADFAHWHPTLRDLISDAETPYRWALYERPALAQWYHGRTILIGDACHPLLPFMAQGAAMAIEDGYRLAQIAARSPDMRRIGPEFQNQRARRIDDVRRATLRNARLFHLPTPARRLAQIALNLTSRIAPNTLLWQQNPIYGYNPTMHEKPFRP